MIRSARDFYDVMLRTWRNFQGHFDSVIDRFRAQRAAAIFNREVHWVPVTGEGRVSRSIQHFEPLRTANALEPAAQNTVGIQRLHQIVDIHAPGNDGTDQTTQVGVRLHSCHDPECPCAVGNFSECKRIELVGRSWVADLRPRSAEGSTSRYTRDSLRLAGVAHGKAANLGDIIAIELAYDEEVYLFGRVSKKWYIADRDYDSEWMGKIEQGDELLALKRFDPVSPGSSYFDETDEEIEVFIDDIRDRLVEGRQLTSVPLRQSRGRRNIVRWLLDSGYKADLLTRIGREDALKGRNSAGHPRRIRNRPEDA